MDRKSELILNNLIKNKDLSFNNHDIERSIFEKRSCINTQSFNKSTLECNSASESNLLQTMPLQSDSRIPLSDVIRIKNDLHSNIRSSTYIKKEIPSIETEQIDSLCNSSENMNQKSELILVNLMKKEDVSFNNDVTERPIFEKGNRKTELILDNLIKNEDASFNIDDTEQPSFEKRSNAQIFSKSILECNSASENTGLTKSKGTDSRANEEIQCDSLSKNNTLNTLPKSNTLNKISDISDESFTVLNKFSDETAKITDTCKPLKQKNKFTEYYMKHYEKQVELLDNPDCQKIISMGMTKKEKDRARVLCRECGKTVTFRYYVSVHVHTHIGNKPFKCNICSRSFVREYILKQHMRVHVDAKKFTCDICGRPFRTLQGAEIHKKTHSDERSYQCHSCDKSFKYKETLRQHLLTHKADKNFMCELCGKSFRNSTGLIRHKLTHNTERTFMCTVCGKGFKSQQLLNYHTKRHSDIKPYLCRYCGTRFKSNNVLKSHVLIHTGAKPFSCKICNKQFRQRPSLRYHMRIHTGETPFECDVCSSKFKYKQHLSNHMKVHRNEFPNK